VLSGAGMGEANPAGQELRPSLEYLG